MELKTREFRLGHPTPCKYPPNLIKNQKYNLITFMPMVRNVFVFSYSFDGDRSTNVFYQVSSDVNYRLDGTMKEM